MIVPVVDAVTFKASAFAKACGGMASEAGFWAAPGTPFEKRLHGQPLIPLI